jgi:hypothetical protein
LLLACVLLMVAGLMWACLDESTPTPAGPGASSTIWPLWTRAVAAERTLVAVETLAADLAASCGLAWDCCENARLTAAAPTPVLSAVPSCVPHPTYTLYPSVTAEPPFCRRCVIGHAEYGCPDGYVCEECSACYFLCVPADTPRAGCNFCAGILIP